MREKTVLEYERETATRPVGLGFLARAWPGTVGTAIIFCRGGYIIERGTDDVRALSLVHFSLELAAAVLLVLCAIKPRPRLVLAAVVLLAAVTFVYLPGLLGDWIGWGNFRFEAIDLYCLLTAGRVLWRHLGGRPGWSRPVTLTLCGIGILVVGTNTLAFYAYNLAFNWARGHLLSLSLVPGMTYCVAAALLVAGGVGTLWRVRVAALVAWFAMLAWTGMFEVESVRSRIVDQGVGIQLWRLFDPSDLYVLGKLLGDLVVARGAMAAIKQDDGRR